MKRGLKLLGIVAASAAVSAAVTYALGRVREMRDYEPSDWDYPGVGFCGRSPESCKEGDGGCHVWPDCMKRAKEATQCHHMPGSCIFRGCSPSDLSEEEKAEYFCPYGGIPGCDKHEVGTDGVTCKFVGGANCPGVTYNPEEESSGSTPDGFCPYNEVGCLSPKDFPDDPSVCPCAGGGDCLREHTVAQPGDGAFGGEYGGHGLHAEEVAFEGKDVSGDDHSDPEVGM